MNTKLFLRNFRKQAFSKELKFPKFAPSFSVYLIFSHFPRPNSCECRKNLNQPTVPLIIIDSCHGVERVEYTEKGKMPWMTGLFRVCTASRSGTESFMRSPCSLLPALLISRFQDANASRQFFQPLQNRASRQVIRHPYAQTFPAL